jgi:hypothetical protein
MTTIAFFYLEDTRAILRKCSVCPPFKNVPGDSHVQKWIVHHVGLARKRMYFLVEEYYLLGYNAV